MGKPIPSSLVTNDEAAVTKRCYKCGMNFPPHPHLTDVIGSRDKGSKTRSLCKWSLNVERKGLLWRDLSEKEKNEVDLPKDGGEVKPSEGGLKDIPAKDRDRNV